MRDPEATAAARRRYEERNPGRWRARKPRTEAQLALQHAAQKRWRQSEVGRAAQRRYDQKPNSRLKRTLRRRIWNVLRRRGGSRAVSAVRDLGCTVEELRAYLEARFAPGMTWANHGWGPGTWQIDHIRPLASFDLGDPEQARQAVHHTNLRPIWYEEHVRKSGGERRSLLEA